jgi:hypothetical protein
MKNKKIGRDSVKVNNEINIKINNSNEGSGSKQTSKQSEEKALKRLSNMEYDNNAILMSSGRGNTRGSGGSILLPPRDVDPNYNSMAQVNQNLNNNKLTDDAVKSIRQIFTPRDTNDPNAHTSGQTIKDEPIVEEPPEPPKQPKQTATVEFLDEEDNLITDSEAFGALTQAEQNRLLIEDAKKKGKGRPKGSKNKPKPETVSYYDENGLLDTSSISFQSLSMKKRSELIEEARLRGKLKTPSYKPTFQPENKPSADPFHSQFDTTGTSAIFESEKEQTLKSGDFGKSNPYTEHLNTKLTMNQTPPRPDKNVEIKKKKT